MLEQALFLTIGVVITLTVMILKYLLNRRNHKSSGNSNSVKAETQALCNAIHTDHEKFTNLLVQQGTTLTLFGKSLDGNQRINERIARVLEAQTSVLGTMKETMVTKEYIQRELRGIKQ